MLTNGHVCTMGAKDTFTGQKYIIPNLDNLHVQMVQNSDQDHFANIEELRVVAEHCRGKNEMYGGMNPRYKDESLKANRTDPYSSEKTRDGNLKW